VQPLLEVKDLKTSFFTARGEVRAVDGVSFSVAPGKLTGIVGESGSGKTVSVLSIMRLLPASGRVVGGSITLDGSDLLRLSEPEMRAIRGARIAMIFQEPMTSLNPVFTVGSQIGESIRLHQRTTRAETRNRTIEALQMVGIADPERRIRDYPHQMSGGMRQRVMIAMALACNPKLLIADEPTTALDVTVQAQILDLMRALRDETGAAIMLITHDLGVIAELAQDVIVMYAGKVVERAEVAALFADPQHPYTVGLLGSIPKLHADQPRLATIEGMVPNPLDMPPGCRFNPRCPFAIDKCRASEPPLAEVKPGHFSACWRAPLEDHVL
jgi:peptide/nickel transport system ATP-binding protein